MQQICISQSYSTGTSTGSTTTLKLRQSNTQWNKIRGYSVDILELLNDCGGLSTIEIANRIDKTPKYISNYLAQLQHCCHRTALTTCLNKERFDG